jgi:2,3,4,5-tetrahydropyridine-2-carboxylate N-succinyltransferase
MKITLAPIIHKAYENRHQLTPTQVDQPTRSAIQKTIELLDQGKIRVAEKINGTWVVENWIKEAILLFFRIEENRVIKAGDECRFFDKVPLKFSHFEQKQFKEQGARIVPGAYVRQGAYLAANTILMPSYVNIGAYIDSGCMIDTWATVGSCAQIGKNVHLSGGAGIGGVLEPIQANPTIIEDNCFIGARSEIVEGVVVEENSVISMGVYIGQSTPIYHRERDEILYGRVPAGSVVVPGTRPSKQGNCHLYCAVIVKEVDANTRAKTSINELLRNIEVEARS